MRVFSSKSTAFAVSMLIALAALFISVEQVGLAIPSILIAMAWTVAWIWRSESQTWTGHTRRLAGSAGTVALTILVLVLVISFQAQKERASLSSYLVPDDVPVSRNWCTDAKPEGMLSLYIGGSILHVGTFPFPILRFKNKEDLFVIDRMPDGSIAVSLEIFDADNKIIADIERNQFKINENNVFRKDDTDRSRLVIYDQRNTKVLDLHYRNPSTFVVNAVLYYNKHQIVLTPQYVLVDGYSAAGTANCAVAGGGEGYMDLSEIDG